MEALDDNAHTSLSHAQGLLTQLIIAKNMKDGIIRQQTWGNAMMHYIKAAADRVWDFRVSDQTQKNLRETVEGMIKAKEGSTFLQQVDLAVATYHVNQSYRATAAVSAITTFNRAYQNLYAVMRALKVANPEKKVTPEIFEAMGVPKDRIIEAHYLHMGYHMLIAASALEPLKELLTLHELKEPRGSRMIVPFLEASTWAFSRLAHPDLVEENEMIFEMLNKRIVKAIRTKAGKVVSIVVPE